MAELVALSYSPWSEKARWALDHHRVTYAFREYVPMLFEPWLRLRLGRPLGQVSVPVLLGSGGGLQGSFPIAREAERIGGGARLFPEGRLADIVAWNDRSEAALTAGRVLVVTRMGLVPAARYEALPKFIPETVRPLLGAMGAMGIAFVRRKYALGTNVEAAEITMRAALESFRAALGGRAYLFEELSYADIAMAVVLQMVRPVRDAFIPLGPGIREAWSNARLAGSFGDLLEWRDALYAKHRRG